MLLSLSGLVFGIAAAPAAVPTTYAETVAECVTLFTPVVTTAQAQALVADRPLAAAAEIDGNSDQCSVDFKPGDWAPDQPGSATPLLLFSVTHGTRPLSSFDQQATMAARLAKTSYRALESAEAGSGVDKGYVYTGFGRHWRVLKVGSNVVTVQIAERYPAQTLEKFAQQVLTGVSAPALREWRERK